MLPSLSAIRLNHEWHWPLYEGNGSNPITPSGIAIITLSRRGCPLHHCREPQRHSHVER